MICFLPGIYIYQWPQLMEPSKELIQPNNNYRRLLKEAFLPVFATIFKILKFRGLGSFALYRTHNTSNPTELVPTTLLPNTLPTGLLSWQATRHLWTRCKFYNLLHQEKTRILQGRLLLIGVLAKSERLQNRSVRTIVVLGWALSGNTMSRFYHRGSP